MPSLQSRNMLPICKHAGFFTNKVLLME